METKIGPTFLVSTNFQLAIRPQSRDLAENEIFKTATVSHHPSPSTVCEAGRDRRGESEEAEQVDREKFKMESANKMNEGMRRGQKKKVVAKKRWSNTASNIRRDYMAFLGAQLSPTHGKRAAH